MKWASCNTKFCVTWTILVAVALFLAPSTWARTDLFFVAPQTVVATPGQEATLTIYVKAERLRAFGFSLLLDTRYITFVPNSLSKTDLTKDFDFIGANLIDDETYDENRPYLKELIIGGSVLEPVSTVWDDGGKKHGIAALATFKIRLVDGFSMPQEGYLPIPVARDKTVNDFVSYRQGGGILFFSSPGEVPPDVRIIAPGIEERLEDANVTLEGEVIPHTGQSIDQVMWIDPFMIQDPSPGDFVVGRTTTLTVDYSDTAPTIQTVFFAALDTNQNGAATGTIFGINEDVIVEFQGQIKGLVRDATLLEPITGAEVILYEEGEGGLRRIQSVFSDSQGEFYMDGVGKGTYTLIAHKDGYQEGVQSVVLTTDNSTVEGVVIELFPLGRPTGEVYTYLTGSFCVSYASTGSAAKGFKVEDITGLYSCTTGDDGCCQIDALRKGEEFHYMWHAVGEDGYTLASVPQAVPENGEIRLDAYPQGLTTLEVQVLDPVTMLGVEGVNIQVINEETGTTDFSIGPTGPSGTLDIDDLEPGIPYAIVASIELNDLTHEVRHELVLDEGANHLTMFLHTFDLDGPGPESQTGGYLTIQILDGEALRPVEVAPQKIDLRDQGGNAVIVQSKDGHYEARGLGGGNYTISLDIPGYVPVENRTISLDGQSVQALVVYLYKDASPSLSLTTIGQLGKATIHGLLLAMDTLEPIWNAQVTLKDASGRAVLEARTNALGQFETKDLTPGDYEISVWANGYQGLTKRVTLAPGDTGQVTMRLFPLVKPEEAVSPSSNATSVLHGVVLSSVLDFSPSPIARAKVRGIGVRDGRTLFERYTDSAGNFVVHSGLGEEPFMLEVEAAGYEARTIGPVQLSRDAILFKSIYLIPQGSLVRFSTSGLGGEVAQFMPEQGRLILFEQGSMVVTDVDQTYKVIRPVDSFAVDQVPRDSTLCFGVASSGESGLYALAYSSGAMLRISPMYGTSPALEKEVISTTFPEAITSLTYRYPLLIVSSNAGLTALDLYGSANQPSLSSGGAPRIVWHLDTLRPVATYLHDDGIIAVENDGTGYFVETFSPTVPVIKEEWSLSFQPTSGSIGGEFGIFCDLAGDLVPVRQGESRGYYTSGRHYAFSSFKRALVFTIPHPFSGYEGKEMALALILEDGWLDLVELTDLNLWLLRRYPVDKVEDMFISKVWRQYTLGQDRYEGAAYLVGPSGVAAIAMPKYLGLSHSITAMWEEGRPTSGHLFTNKGYLFNLGTLGQGDAITFDVDPGVYDVYLVGQGGRAQVAASVGAFGNQVADFRRKVKVGLETITYPVGPTRVFHGGDHLGVSLELKAHSPVVADGYLLTSVELGGTTYYYYWLMGQDGVMRAYPYGPDLETFPPQPLGRGIYLDNTFNTRLELVALPEEVPSLKGQMTFLLLSPGEAFDENATKRALGSKILNFTISGR